MSENGEIYTAGKNFTLPPAVSALTNSTSAIHKLKLKYNFVISKCTNVKSLCFTTIILFGLATKKTNPTIVAFRVFAIFFYNARIY